ncbi:MAG TPA: hypothetical protein VHA54_08040 [Solirubrobacterales bacterium]|nr:hypothetical protein [Solirubrobacterales bacterium]
MAASGGEQRRMVFDIRGRRRNVVKVVYAILALLMGLSLFLVVGPFNVANLFGGSETSNASAVFVEQAENVEAKLRKDPEDPELLLRLTKARINAGNASAELNPETGAPQFTEEGKAELERASEAWSKYLKATDEPSPGGAQAAAPMFFSLAQLARTGPEAEINLRAAAKAQQIVAEQRPSLGSLSTLAIYRNYSFDYAGAKKAEKEAEKYANTKFERESLGNELSQVEKRAKEFQKQLAEIAKENKKARAEGKGTIANPLAEGSPLGG